MWETYVEPILKAQAEIRKEAGTGDTMNGPTLPSDNEPMTIERKLAEAQAAGMMFGVDPLEIGKAVRKSYGQKADLEAMRQKLLAREGVKAS